MHRTGLMLVVLMLAGVPVAHAAADAAAQHLMAPTGTLRVGVYRGSPTSIIEGSSPDDARGVGYDLGHALAAELDVPFQPAVFPANDSLLAAAAAGQVDVVFTNRTPERERTLDYSATFMDVAKNFLVPADSTLTALPDFTRPGLRMQRPMALRPPEPGPA